MQSNYFEIKHRNKQWNKKWRHWPKLRKMKYIVCIFWCNFILWSLFYRQGGKSAKKNRMESHITVSHRAKYLWLQRFNGQPEFVTMYIVFVYKRVYVAEIWASAAGASWFCPAFPCTLWGIVLDRGPGPSLRHAALLQPLQSTDSHWHYISWGDIVDCVCVCVCVCVCWSVDAPFSLLLWGKTKWSADHLSRFWLLDVSSVEVERKGTQPWLCASYVEWKT